MSISTAAQNRLLCGRLHFHRGDESTFIAVRLS